jgi:Ca2+-binding EF-hand superfamily protein
VRLVESQVRHHTHAVSSLTTVASIHIAFDQALYAAGIPMTAYASHHALQQRVQGLTRLACGTTLIESHPDASDNKPDHVTPVESTGITVATATGSVVPSLHHLVAFLDIDKSTAWSGSSSSTTHSSTDSESDDPSGAKLLRYSPNIFRLSLLLSDDAFDRTLAAQLTAGQCTLEFLHADQQDWKPSTNLSNSNGELFTGTVAIHAASQNDIHDMQQLNAFAVAHAQHNRLDVHHDMDQAFAKPFEGKMIALVEVMARVNSMSTLGAGQVLELITDPIIHMATPVVVSIITSIIRDQVISTVSQTLSPLLLDPVVKPILEALETTASAEVIQTVPPYEGPADLTTPIEDGNPNQPPVGDKTGYLPKFYPPKGAGKMSPPSKPSGGPDKPAPSPGSKPAAAEPKKEAPKPAPAPAEQKPPAKPKNSTEEMAPPDTPKGTPVADQAPTAPLSPEQVAQVAKEQAEKSDGAVAPVVAKDAPPPEPGALTSPSLPHESFSPHTVARIKSQKSVYILWNMYHHLTREKDPSSEYEDQVINESDIRRMLLHFLGNATTHAKTQTDDGSLTQFHSDLAACIRTKVPQAAHDMVTMVAEKPSVGITFSEFKDDWNYDHPNQVNPNAYKMRIRIEATIQLCQSQVVAEEADKVAENTGKEFMFWDISQSDVISNSELTRAGQLLLPYVASILVSEKFTEAADRRATMYFPTVILVNTKTDLFVNGPIVSPVMVGGEKARITFAPDGKCREPSTHVGGQMTAQPRKQLELAPVPKVGKYVLCASTDDGGSWAQQSFLPTLHVIDTAPQFTHMYPLRFAVGSAIELHLGHTGSTGNTKVTLSHDKQCSGAGHVHLGGEHNLPAADSKRHESSVKLSAVEKPCSLFACISVDGGKTWKQQTELPQIEVVDTPHVIRSFVPVRMMLNEKFLVQVFTAGSDFDTPPLGTFALPGKCTEPKLHMGGHNRIKLNAFVSDGIGFKGAFVLCLSIDDGKTWVEQVLPPEKLIISNNVISDVRANEALIAVVDPKNGRHIHLSALDRALRDKIVRCATPKVESSTAALMKLMDTGGVRFIERAEYNAAKLEIPYNDARLLLGCLERAGVDSLHAFLLADHDNDGRLTMQELEDVLQQRIATNVLPPFGVPLFHGRSDDAWSWLMSNDTAARNMLSQLTGDVNANAHIDRNTKRAVERQMGRYRDVLKALRKMITVRLQNLTATFDTVSDIEFMRMGGVLDDLSVELTKLANQIIVTSQNKWFKYLAEHHAEISKEHAFHAHWKARELWEKRKKQQALREKHDKQRRNMQGQQIDSELRNDLKDRKMYFNWFDRDRSETITTDEIEYALRQKCLRRAAKLRPERSQQDYWVIKSCVDHHIPVLAAYVMDQFDVDGIPGIQVTEFSIDRIHEDVQRISWQVAGTCANKTQDAFGNMFDQLDTDHNGQLSREELWATFHGMIQLARIHYGKSYASIHPCVDAAIPLMVARVFRKLDQGSKGFITHNEFSRHPYFVLDVSQEQVSKCRAKMPSIKSVPPLTFRSVDYTDAWAAQLWRKYLDVANQARAKEDVSNINIDKPRAAVSSLSRHSMMLVLRDMLGYAAEHAAPMDHFHEVQDCLWQPENLPTAVRAIYRQHGLSAKSQLHWKQFRTMPNALMNAAEHALESCYNSIRAPAEKNLDGTAAEPDQPLRSSDRFAVGPDGKPVHRKPLSEYRFRELHTGRGWHGFVDFGQWSFAFFFPEDLLTPDEGEHDAELELVEQQQQLQSQKHNKRSKKARKRSHQSKANQEQAKYAELAFVNMETRMKMAEHVSAKGRERLDLHTKARTKARMHRSQTGALVFATETSRARAIFDVPNPFSSGELTDRTDIALSDSAREAVYQSLHLSLTDNLRFHVNSSCVESLSRAIIKKTTVDLTDSLATLMMRSVSDPYVETATRFMTKVMTPTLTHSLAAVITKSMGHRPQDDYFCWYCKNKNSYCEYCEGFATRDGDLDYYTSYFAQFYSDYFSKFYALEANIFAVSDIGQPFDPSKPAGNDDVPTGYTARQERDEYEPPRPFYQVGGSNQITSKSGDQTEPGEVGGIMGGIHGLPP